LYPAVLREEEIDLESFLSAEGREGVEDLVGEAGSVEGEGWKYWRP
jgi:mevalonate kinase